MTYPVHKKTMGLAPSGVALGNIILGCSQKKSINIFLHLPAVYQSWLLICKSMGFSQIVQISKILILPKSAEVLFSTLLWAWIQLTLPSLVVGGVNYRIFDFFHGIQFVSTP